MKKLYFLICIWFVSVNAMAQPELPYAEIPEYPDAFTAETVAARMLDGLGFRYYWATDNLRPEDLDFKPSEDARTSRETLEHIFGLTQMIVNSTRKVPNERMDISDWSFEQLRSATLSNIEEASNSLKDPGAKLEDFKIIYERGERRTEFPFWNHINGPIADALWHVGQVVTFRRSSGNPFNSKVSLFNGRVRE